MFVVLSLLKRQDFLVNFDLFYLSTDSQDLHKAMNKTNVNFKQGNLINVEQN
jgi:hypothetical protein